MTIYSLLRPLLFRLPPERAHSFTLNVLKYIPACFFRQGKGESVDAMGLHFAHPVGLAAGLDKNAEYLDALAKLGFSFIEVGTVTPRPQLGNPSPRLFRLVSAQALINRMGFNNVGVDQVVKNIQTANYRGILGINLGKNKDTPLERAADDYVYGLEKVYPYASYVTINISSPNTPELRRLQGNDYFQTLITQLKNTQGRLADQYQRHVPLVVKLSPDETTDTLKKVADTIVNLGIEGIIATNTTCDRTEISELPHADEQGGLSGKPLFDRSTSCLKTLKEIVGDAVTLIASGGVHDVTAAQKKFVAGASLIQIYTGLIYAGPPLIRQLLVPR